MYYAKIQIFFAEILNLKLFDQYSNAKSVFMTNQFLEHYDSYIRIV